MALAGALTLALSGCALVTPPPPKSVRYEGDSTQYSKDDLNSERAKYDTAMTGTTPNLAAARLLRDRMIHRIRVDIDIWYAAQEAQLYEQRAGMNTFADFVELGLAGATSLTNGEHAKTVLATILSVGKGTRLSFDKNWFREKATESLINTMRSGRNTKLADILQKMTANSADKYTFEEAWGDLIAYYQAGTIYSALVSLSADTGQKATKSEAELKKANEPRYAKLFKATEQDVTTTEQIRAKAAAMTEAQAREVLGKLKVVIPANADAAKITELLNAQVHKLATATSEERIDIIAAFN